MSADTFAWLVETVSGVPTYWAGGNEWTTEHAKAVRLSRRVDAEKVRLSLPKPDQLIVTEHGWYNP